MKGPSYKITGILLSGGKSSRMGREKGNIRIGKYLMYQYPLKVLESLCDEIIISTCKPDDFKEKYDRVCDEIPGIGPLGGIYSCLKYSSNDINIVLSYDLPLVNRALFLELLKSVQGNDIVLPALSSEHPEPLCAIYRKSTCEVFRSQIDENVFAVHKAFPLVRTKIVIIEESLPFYHPKIFLNVNQESDLDNLPTDLINRE